MLRCGQIDPGNAPTASSSRRNSAVRMLVSCRHIQRSQPTGPSVGWVMSWAISDHRPEAGDERGLQVAGQRVPETRDEQDTDDEQQRTTQQLYAALPLAQERRDPAEPLVARGD